MCRRLTSVHAEPVPTVAVADRQATARGDEGRLRARIGHGAAELAVAMSSHRR
jgi:hypothetical protein